MDKDAAMKHATKHDYLLAAEIKKDFLKAEKQWLAELKADASNRRKTASFIKEVLKNSKRKN